MRVVILLCCLLAVGCQSSKQVQKKSPKFNSIEISCETSPSEAKLELAAPAREFARVMCTDFGHLITSTKGWLWTKPGMFGATFYPAQMVQKNPKQVKNEIYFSQINVRNLAYVETMERWDFIGSDYDRDLEAENKMKSMEITAVNNSGKYHKIYIFNNGWGYGCSPTCKKTEAFLLLNSNNKEVFW